MTINDADTREAAEEGSSWPPLDLEVTAEARAHAREGLPSAAETASAAFAPVVAWRDAASLWLAQLVAPQGSLWLAQPPSFAQAHARHRECAAHFQAGAFRWPRQAYGYLHLLVILPVLYLAGWVTASPVTVAVAAALIFVIVHFG